MPLLQLRTVAPMMKMTVEVVVDTDDETAVYDGLNDGFRVLEGYGFIVDWAYMAGPPTRFNISRDQYEEGEAWRTAT